MMMSTQEEFVQMTTSSYITGVKSGLDTLGTLRDKFK